MPNEERGTRYAPLAAFPGDSSAFRELVSSNASHAVMANDSFRAVMANDAYRQLESSDMFRALSRSQSLSEAFLNQAMHAQQ